MTARRASPLVFLDVETDGLHAGCRPWEIAMIRRDPDGLEAEYSVFVEVNLGAADPKALAIGGFYERHPYGRFLSGRLGDRMPRPGAGSSHLNYVSSWDAAMLVARVTHGAHLVGVNPAFDAAVLTRFLARRDVVPGWHYHLVDLVAMSVGFLNGDETRDLVLPPFSSDALSRACGVLPPDASSRHTAVGDARWVRRWWDLLVPLSSIEGTVSP